MIDQFSLDIGYDVRTYYSDLYDFVRNGQPNIVKYYSGLMKTPDRLSFNELDRLIAESEKLNNIIKQKRNTLLEGEYWEILDEIEEAKVKLLTISNTWKWMRSSVTNNLFSTKPQMEVITTQNQTLEDLSLGLGIKEWDDRWMEVAIKNNIKEEDYTNDGGLKLQVSFDNSNAITIKDVVDSMTGELVYGKDIYRVITFEDDDIKTLAPVDTVYQCIEILMGLSKGDLPSDPNFGIRKITGNNVKSISFPTLFRQIQQVLGTDDVIRSVSLGSLDKEEDIISVKVIISIKHGGQIVKTIDV